MMISQTWYLATQVDYYGLKEKSPKNRLKTV